MLPGASPRAQLVQPLPRLPSHVCHSAQPAGDSLPQLLHMAVTALGGDLADEAAAAAAEGRSPADCQRVQIAAQPGALLLVRSTCALRPSAT